MANDNVSALLGIKGSSSGGGAEKFVITVTRSGGSYSANKTWAQILAAYQAGSVLEVHQADVVAELTYMDTDGAAEWCQVGTRLNGIGAILYNVSSSGGVDTWTMVNKTFVEAPAVEEDLESTSITLASAADNTIYEYGELTSLTISNPPATGKYSIIFFSGATATVVTGIDNFTVEANKRYQIDVQDGYAKLYSWPYTPTP